LNNLEKVSTTQSSTRPLCNSWASCKFTNFTQQFIRTQSEVE